MMSLKDTFSPYLMEVRETFVYVRNILFHCSDHLGVLNFLEFCATMWNLLTLTDRNLGLVAYLMKDPSGVMKIRCK